MAPRAPTCTASPGRAARSCSATAPAAASARPTSRGDGRRRGAGVSVALVEQPYRVAGRRSPAPARQLDAAWVTVVDELRRRSLRGLPLSRRALVGRARGVSYGCEVGAAGVLCLAFPLQPPAAPAEPPGRAGGRDVPVLIVQGENDRFGCRRRARSRGRRPCAATTACAATRRRSWTPSAAGSLTSSRDDRRLHSRPPVRAQPLRRNKTRAARTDRALLATPWPTSRHTRSSVRSTPASCVSR